jgi:malate dehydrogenase (oxaloacetate-decarboxylating)
MMRDVMIREGLSEQEATGRFWAVDSRGLLTNDYAGPLRDFQQPYCRPVAEVECRPRHEGDPITLADVVVNVKPTMLIGTSTQSGARPADRLGRPRDRGSQRRR